MSSLTFSSFRSYLIEAQSVAYGKRSTRFYRAGKSQLAMAGSPTVCLGIIAKYGHYSHISAQSERNFSAVKTCWRRERDSNPRYGFPYSGFQDRLFQPLTHPSARTGNRVMLSRLVYNRGCTNEEDMGFGRVPLKRYDTTQAPRVFNLQASNQRNVFRSRCTCSFRIERLGMKLHDLGEVSQEIGQAVVAGIRTKLVLDAFLLQLFV